LKIFAFKAFCFNVFLTPFALTFFVFNVFCFKKQPMLSDLIKKKEKRKRK